MKLHAVALAATLFALLACQDALGPVELRLNVLTPSCTDPAPLLGNPDSRVADSYIVVYEEGTDSRSTTEALEEKHDFDAVHVYEHALSGFAAVLPAETVAALRCESVVQYIEHDGVVTISGTVTSG